MNTKILRTVQYRLVVGHAYSKRNEPERDEVASDAAAHRCRS